MTSGNQLEFLQFTSYVRYFLVEILIETCSKGFSFGNYSNNSVAKKKCRVWTRHFACVPHPLIFSRLNFSRLIGGRSLAGDYGNSCLERRVWKPVICPQNDPAKLLCVRFHMHACVHTTCMLVVLRTVQHRCPPCLQACHLFL